MCPLISVIVPIYNAENYLHRCLDSILAQTLTDFELILVNDGSTDCSGKICDEYALKDNRIKVIHKSNGGVASARQMGVDNALGNYTIHADPDDWVEPTMLEELYKKAIEKDADIVICDFYVQTCNTCITRTQRISEESSEATLLALLSHKLHGSLWNKLIRLECYKKFNIRFVEGLNFCEDYLVCIKMLKNDIKVAYLNKAFYYYDQFTNDNSITRKYTLDTYRQRLFFINELKSCLEGKYNNYISKNEAIVAIECLRHGVLEKAEFKRTYSKKRWKLLMHINGYRNKLKFIIATLF